MQYVDTEHERTPSSEGRFAALAHRVGVETPHLVVALTTLVAGIAALIAL